MRNHRRRTFSVLFALSLAAGPSPSSAGPVTFVVPEAPATTIVPASERALGAVAIARVVEAELAAGRRYTPQAPAPASAPSSRDSVWNGLLIGAAIGAGFAVYAVSNNDCTGEVIGCSSEGPSGEGTVVALSILVGAGLGTIVDLLIK